MRHSYLTISWQRASEADPRSGFVLNVVDPGDGDYSDIPVQRLALEQVLALAADNEPLAQLINAIADDHLADLRRHEANCQLQAHKASAQAEELAQAIARARGQG